MHLEATNKNVTPPLTGKVKGSSAKRQMSFFSLRLPCLHCKAQHQLQIKLQLKLRVVLKKEKKIIWNTSTFPLMKRIFKII